MAVPGVSQDTLYEPTQQLNTVSQQPPSQQHTDPSDPLRIWGRAVSTNSEYATIDLCGFTPIVFGRKKNCSAQIDNPAISGEHCSIHYDYLNDVAYLTDLSTNGTYIDGIKIGRKKCTVLANNTEFILLKTQYEKISYIFFSMSKQNALHSNERIADTYDVREQIGSGTFAAVKLCIHKKTGVKYALKIIDKQKFFQYHSSDRKDVLDDEMKILQLLDHPNIIKIYDSYDSDKYVYLILEYVSGGDLFDRIISLNGKGFAENDAKFIFAQLCDAVAFLHQSNIIHRDLKPENVLLQYSDSLIVKLSDFGLSRILNERNNASTQCGTPQYLAPEILEHQTYTKAVDCWSLGVILYILLSGRSPFSQDPGKMNQQIKTGKIDFNQKYWRDVSTVAKDLVKRLIHVNPTQRIKVEDIYAHPWLKDSNYVRDGIATSLHTQQLRNSAPVQHPAAGSQVVLGETPLLHSSKRKMDDNDMLVESPAANFPTDSNDTHKRHKDTHDSTNNVAQTLNFNATSPDSKKGAKSIQSPMIISSSKKPATTSNDNKENMNDQGNQS